MTNGNKNTINIEQIKNELVKSKKHLKNITLKSNDIIEDNIRKSKGKIDKLRDLKFRSENLICNIDTKAESLKRKNIQFKNEIIRKFKLEIKK